MGVCFLFSLLVPSLGISFVLSQSGAQACFFISAISYVACMLYVVAILYDKLNWFSYQACFFISAISYVACMLYVVAILYDKLNWFSYFSEAIQ